jgi:hypothetical protein
MRSPEQTAICASVLDELVFPPLDSHRTVKAAATIRKRQGVPECTHPSYDNRRLETVDRKGSGRIDLPGPLPRESASTQSRDGYFLRGRANGVLKSYLTYPSRTENRSSNSNRDTCGEP